MWLDIDNGCVEKEIMRGMVMENIRNPFSFIVVFSNQELVQPVID